MSKLTLYHFGSVYGLPDLSPFCCKLETYLRLAQIPFDKKQGNPRRSPKGKLPYIRLSDRFLSDSDQIILELKRTFGDPLDQHLSAEDLALGRAYQSMLEEHFYFILVYFRWKVPEGWEIYKEAIGGLVKQSGVPGFLLPVLLPAFRKQATKTLHLQGVGRHSFEEIRDTGLKILDSVATFLGDKPFFFGDKPSSLDAIVSAFVDGVLIPPLPSPLRTYAQGQKNLVAYSQRVRLLAYPEASSSGS